MINLGNVEYLLYSTFKNNSNYILIIKLTENRNNENNSKKEISFKNNKMDRLNIEKEKNELSREIILEEDKRLYYEIYQVPLLPKINGVKVVFGEVWSDGLIKMNFID